MSILAETQYLSKQFDGIVALASFSCEIFEGEILGLLGPNGAGKTTLFNVLTGLEPPDSGHVKFKGRDLIGRPVHQIAGMGIGRTFQKLHLIRQITVLENVLLGFKDQPGENLLNVFLRPRRCQRHEAEIREKAWALLKVVGLDGMANNLAYSLSYGQQKLLAFICCLAVDAKLLLLDEPVAGIAPNMAECILAAIADLPQHGKSAIVIEHDIEALKGVAHRMIFMDAGRKICEGTPDEVLSDPKVVEAYLD